MWGRWCGFAAVVAVAALTVACSGDDTIDTRGLPGGSGGRGSGGNGGAGGTGGLTTGLGVGEDCSADTECRPGLVCDLTCQPGHTQGEGDPCTISAECQTDLYCAGGLCAPAGDGTDGDECVTDVDCQNGFRCALEGFKAVCVPEGNGDINSSCDVATDCYGALTCADGICQPVPPGLPPFGLPWGGVDCPEETGPVAAYFRIPRSGDTGDFFQLPIPNDVRMDGTTIDLTGFPTPGAGLLGYDIVQRYVDAVEASSNGWGVYGGVYFRFSDIVDTDSFEGNIHVVDLTTGGGHGFRWFYSFSGGTYSCRNRVIVTRGQGRIWEPGHTYAVYFLDGVKTDTGDDVEKPADLVALLGAATPSDPVQAAEYPKYALLRQYLTDQGIAAGSVLNASVFTIGQPRSLVEQMQAVVDAVPKPASDWTLCDAGVPSPCSEADGERACGAADPDYDELHALVDLPIFQEGTAPYLTPGDGGGIKQAGGVPVIERTEPVCMGLTVPKGVMPPGGWPVVVYAHGTGGHFRSFIASGIGDDFAKGVSDGQGNVVKAAVLSIDEVTHGPRRNGSTESPDDLFFNFANPNAAVGNPVQGAADQMSLLSFAPSVSFDALSSPTGVAFNLANQVAFWGHSQGATHGGIAMPYGDWAGVLFTGQGASLRDSLVTKTSPVNIAGLLPFILQDFDSNGELFGGSRHPVLSLLLQHHIESGDPVTYGNLMVLDPATTEKNVFQVYGLDDTYTTAVVQATYARAAGLDVVVHHSSVAVPDDIGGKVEVPAPASGNIAGGSISAYVREYQPSSADDGHFVGTQVSGARSDGERFIAGALSGVVPQVGP